MLGGVVLKYLHTVCCLWGPFLLIFFGNRELHVTELVQQLRLVQVFDRVLDACGVA